MACLYAYFIGFLGVVLVIYFLFNSFKAPGRLKNLGKHVLYFLIQLILPYLFLQLLINMSSDVSDRTTTPWGFLYYVSNFDGMFFPYGKPYQEVVGKFNSPDEVTQFEGVSYVGLFAILISIVFLLWKLFQLVRLKFRNFISVGESRETIVFLVAGIAGALYACGIPYIYNEGMVHYIGPLRQMRGLGRFAWLLFYSLNNFVAFFFYKLITAVHRKWVKAIICAIPLLVLYYDAYYNVLPISEAIVNTIPMIEDKENNLPDNKWIKEIDINKYQAIIPLPYFLQGSENVGLEPEGTREILKHTYIASLKTGLPITAAVLSRTSLQQTYNNMSMMLEPYRSLEIVKSLPNKKSFLILAREEEITQFMQRDLLSKAALVKTTPNFNLYELSYNTLAGYSDSLYSTISKEAALMPLFDVERWKSTQTKKDFAYKSYDENPSTLSYRGKGAYEGKIKDYNRIFEDTIPNAVDNQTYILSFWVRDFNKDLYARTMIETAYADSATGKMYGGWWSPLSLTFRTLDSNWALMEVYLKPTHRHDKIAITLWNQDFTDDSRLVVDELWIRPEFTHIYQVFPGEVFKNNRYYLK